MPLHLPDRNPQPISRVTLAPGEVQPPLSPEVFMEIESPGTVAITEDGIALFDFTFTLEEDEFGMTEDELQSLATLVCLRWAIEKIVRRVDALNPAQAPVKTPSNKDFH